MLNGYSKWVVSAIILGEGSGGDLPITKAVTTVAIVYSPKIDNPVAPRIRTPEPRLFAIAHEIVITASIQCVADAHERPRMWGLAYTVATGLLDILTELRFFFKYRLREYPIDALCFLEYHARAVVKWMKSRRVAHRVKQEERRHKLSQLMSLFDY